MALSASEFLVADGGELVPDWFALTAAEEAAGTPATPAAKAAAMLGTWVSKAEGRGYADAGTDYADTGAGVAFVYAAAYRYLLATTFTFEPAEADVDEKGGYRRQEWQLRELKGRLAYWEAVFAAASSASLTDAGGTFTTVRSLR